MASYFATITNAAGEYTPVVRRAGTAASGGTVLALPSGELFPGTSTKLLGLAFDAAKRRALNYRSTTGNATFNINIVDDGSGNFTPELRVGGTAASGGTVLALPAGELFPDTDTLLLGLAIDVAKRRAQNDRSANG